MKRFVYKLLPLIMIFVLLFSTSALAVNGGVPMYSSIYDEYCEICIEAAIYKYLTEVGGTRGELFVYAHTSAQPTNNMILSVYIGIRSNMTVAGTGSSATASGSMIQYDVRYNYDMARILVCNQVATPSVVSFSQNGTVKIQFVYVSEDVYNDIGTLLYACPKPLVEPESEVPKNDFEFDIFDEFQDFTEQSSDYNDVSQKQQVTQNDNNPNDGIFQNILQAISGLVHTGNSITQQISNQIQNFIEQFFNNFAQSALGLLMEIKDSLGNIFPDNLTTIIDQLYESGLDADGNFGIGTMLDYWFVPEDDFVQIKYDELSASYDGILQIREVSDVMSNNLQNLQPATPQIIIPAGTYGFLTFQEDIVLGFEWFAEWKPYTDPIIAAFIYVVFVWHLLQQLPGILNGAASSTAAVAHFNDKEIKAQNFKKG